MLKNMLGRWEHGHDHRTGCDIRSRERSGLGDVGENDSDTDSCEYCGLVDEYPGDDKLRARDIGEYGGKVGAWSQS